MADLERYEQSSAYSEQEKAVLRFAEEWTRQAILNVAGSGKFSSDRTIAQYAAEIWNAKPCPVS